jgi:hypothetical protein
MKVDVLIGLNWRVDTAALLRQRLFPTIEDWLRKVSRWAVLSKKRLVIRRHPGERFPAYSSTDDYAAIAREEDPSGKFVRMVEAADPINTYDLIAAARVVLPYTSQVGIEAAIMGRPVLIAAHCFYSECDFAWTPQSQDEYFYQLRRACEGELTMTEVCIRHAMLSYYIFQFGMEIVTEFSPLLESYEKWSVSEPEKFWQSEPTTGVRTLLLEPEVSLSAEATLQALKHQSASGGK